MQPHRLFSSPSDGMPPAADAVTAEAAGRSEPSCRAGTETASALAHQSVDGGAFCLFLDVDGTLIDLAATPGGVVVPASLIQDLAWAERRLAGALALVSGRTIANLDRLFAPLRLKASGVHGAEFRDDGAGPIRSAASAPLPEATWRDLVALLGDFPGTFVENKSFSFAVHYRAVPASAERLCRALRHFVEERADLALRIMAGHFVYEIKSPGFDKGAAIARFLDTPPFAGRRPMFLGDDVTDRPGFATVLARGGLAFGVGDIAAEVSGRFADPAAVRLWLADLARSSSRVSA